MVTHQRASARGLQLGPGVAVIAFTSVAANLAAIMGGILVFRDPIGIGVPAIVGRVIAFGLVIADAAFMPTPARAGRVVGVSQLATCPGPALSRGAAYSPNARESPHDPSRRLAAETPARRR